jgi:hypothetical protein
MVNLRNKELVRLWAVQDYKDNSFNRFKSNKKTIKIKILQLK